MESLGVLPSEGTCVCVRVELKSAPDDKTHLSPAVPLTRSTSRGCGCDAHLTNTCTRPSVPTPHTSPWVGAGDDHGSGGGADHPHLPSVGRTGVAAAARPPLTAGWPHLHCSRHHHRRLLAADVGKCRLPLLAHPHARTVHPRLDSGNVVRRARCWCSPTACEVQPHRSTHRPRGADLSMSPLALALTLALALALALALTLARTLAPAGSRPLVPRARRRARRAARPLREAAAEPSSRSRVEG